MELTQNFDEKAKNGLDLLLHHYWIIRAEQPEWYRIIREREKVLRRYIDEKFGLRLIVHQHFVKLEKIPVEPERWMGIQEFQEPIDYAIFCCALSFVEGKAVDEQFLLSELCQDIQSDYPDASPLDWTLYTHRKSLIRAMRILLEFRLIRTIDGDIGKFDHDVEQEVLYEATVYSRYFMRSYPDDFSTYYHWSELLQEDWKQSQEDERRKRVYRKLFFSPGLHRKTQQDPDFLYIRNFRNRLFDDIELHSNYKLHVYRNTAFLSTAEPKQQHTVYPTLKASTDILLQLSREIHGQLERFEPNTQGEILLTETELEQVIEELKQQYGSGWSKYFREKSKDAIRVELVAMLREWMMAEVDEQTDMVRLLPLLGVLTGKYPDDYQIEDGG